MHFSNRVVALGLALICGTAVADDKLTEINAVSAAWNRYAALSSQNKAESVELLGSSSLRHYTFIRDAALYASSEQIARIPIADRVVLYAMRATQTDAQLIALDADAVAKLCFRSGWCGVAAPDEGQSLPSLSYVTLIAADRAVGELGPPTGTHFQFGPELVREEGAWKVLSHSLVLDESTSIQQQIQRSGMTETEMLQNIVGRFVGTKREPPLIPILDRPLRNDAAARTRLNEAWPKYEATYQARVQVLENKSVDNDSLAQFALGTLLYSGAMPAVLAKNEARGMQLLEQASANGHGKAAMLVTERLLTTSDRSTLTPKKLQYALPHLRRAAESGHAVAMAGYAQFLFNGVAGLSRNCQLAEEWQTRAEDAGLAAARNERVWTLATCPIPAQRNPARALELAAYMISQADELPSSELDTVAAAYAANARYDDAVAFQERALAKLDKSSNPATRQGMEERLKTYRNRHDWVQDYNVYAQGSAKQ